MLDFINCDILTSIEYKVDIFFLNNSMPKKTQKSDVKKKNSKKETSSVNSSGTKNGLPSLSDMNS
jgi:hypothetical protein